MISKADILKLCPTASPALVEAIVDNWSVAEGAGIYTGLRIAHFFARVAVETGGLRSVEESLTYTSAARLRAVWPSRFKTDAAAAPYIRNPKALAIKVYGGRMGNAPDPSTDGWDYRGGGMLQTTGRDGYRAMGFEDNPEALRDPATAFETAVREWQRRGCNELADADDVEGVCRAINGGTTGLSDQRSYLSKAKAIWPLAGSAKPGAAIQPKAPARASDPITLAVQRALIEKGYHEVGEPDGRVGSRTRGAILAFEADTGRELTGAPSVDLLAAILSAEPRQVADERARGKPADNPVVRDAGLLKGVGAVLGGGGLLGVADPVVSQIEKGAGLFQRVREALATFGSLWPILAIGVALLIVYLATRSQKTVVNDYQSGKLLR